jgi:hypothetical protein
MLRARGLLAARGDQGSLGVVLIPPSIPDPSGDWPLIPGP